jgi:hypothetical protein
MLPIRRRQRKGAKTGGWTDGREAAVAGDDLAAVAVDVSAEASAALAAWLDDPIGT